MFDSYLTERERKILYLYYGLDDGEERTLEEIGSLLGVTRERIRQIRNRAFEKLRESPQGDSLSGFWITPTDGSPGGSDGPLLPIARAVSITISHGHGFRPSES